VRRLLAPLLAIVALAPAPAASAPPASTVAGQLARALRVPHVSQARSAALAVDLASGATLYSQHATLALAPASNEKLAVTYAALAMLGPAFRIETQVLGVGEQDGATWRGSITLRGAGDPTLSTGDLLALAAQVRAAGIRRIAGPVVGDETWFDAQRTVAGWRASFYLGESPPLSALVVDRDRVGGYLSANPALAAATAFRAALRRAGVAVAGSSALGRVDDFAYPLARVVSPPFDAIVRSMNKDSDNFTAEMLLKELGAVLGDGGTSAAGAAVVTGALARAGVPMAGVRIVDGSGLSRLDRLTVGALLGILQAAWRDPAVRGPFVGSLPVAGLSGTLEHRLRGPPVRGNVAAKTGTTREASALSGFVRGRYAFAIVQNGSPLPYWWARRAQDRFASILAALS
jgi:D-alanyl-D-alanine carboxypeptidase/D-alanyl-D-alanine-endopeptidase (penicillin-binding protein 4)